jgi:hypothetical protein
MPLAVAAPAEAVAKAAAEVAAVVAVLNGKMAGRNRTWVSLTRWGMKKISVGKRAWGSV